MVKVKDFSRPLSIFQVLSKANFIFKDFSRQSCIFKYFPSLCQPYIRFYWIIFTFSKQSFNEPYIYATIHNLLNYANLIDSCQAHPCNALRTSNSLAKSDTSVVIDSEPHLSCTCKISLLFAPLAVPFQAGCSAFPFYNPTKLLIRLYFKYKTVLIPKLIFFLFYIFKIKCNFKQNEKSQ